MVLLLLLLRGNRGGGDFFFFSFFLGEGGIGMHWSRGYCSGMVDGFVRSDLVYYQLRDRGRAPLLVLCDIHLVSASLSLSLYASMYDRG